MRRRNEIGGGGGTNGGGISETARLRRARRAEEDLRRKRASVLREAVARRLRHALSGGSGVTSSLGNQDGGSNPNRGGNSVFVLNDDSSLAGSSSRSGPLHPFPLGPTAYIIALFSEQVQNRDFITTVRQD